MKVSNASMEILEAYDIPNFEVSFVSNSDCEIHRIKFGSSISVGEGRFTTEAALRIFPKEKSIFENIQSEVIWLNELANEGVYAPIPLRNKTGEFINEVLNSDGTIQYAIVLTWLSGDFLDESLTESRLAEVGTLLSRLHNTSKILVNSGTLKSNKHSFQCKFDLWVSEGRPKTHYISADFLRNSGVAAGIVREKIATMDCNANSYGFIHGDLHQWNLLFKNNMAGAIDFSDCG